MCHKNVFLTFFKFLQNSFNSYNKNWTVYCKDAAALNI